jgi:glycosyltransferase involved in cell wall biosynthesis
MRLAVVDHIANIGGGRRFTSSLVAALARSSPDCQIRLITSREALVSGWLGDLSGLPVETVGLVTDATLRQWLPDGRINGLPGTWAIKSRVRSTFAKTIYSIQRQLSHALEDIDIAYFPMPHVSAFYKCAVPVVCTFHDLLWKHFEVLSREEKATRERYVAMWLSNSEVVVTITDSLRQDIERFYPRHAKRIEVIRQPAPVLPAPLVGHKRDRLLARWKIRQPYALCVAGLWPHKNHENLIRAWALLKKQLPELMLVCCGPYTDQAFSPSPASSTWARSLLLRDLALSSDLLFGSDIVGTGFVNDIELATLYDNAACLITASIAEGGSLPLLEAVTHQIPVACSDIDVYREQVEFYGLRTEFFDPLNPDAIADTIVHLFRAPHPKEEMNQMARRVDARTWNTVALEYMHIFESL